MWRESVIDLVATFGTTSLLTLSPPGRHRATLKQELLHQDCQPCLDGKGHGNRWYHKAATAIREFFQSRQKTLPEDMDWYVGRHRQNPGLAYT